MKYLTILYLNAHIELTSPNRNQVFGSHYEIDFGNNFSHFLILPLSRT